MNFCRGRLNLALRIKTPDVKRFFTSDNRTSIGDLVERGQGRKDPHIGYIKSLYLYLVQVGRKKSNSVSW